MMLSKLLPFLLIISMTACKVKSGRLASDSVKLNAGIIKKNMDTTVKPGDNFMNYVNGNWINAASDTSLSPSVALAKKTYAISNAIIERIASNPNQISRNVNEQKLGDLYNSYTNLNVREQLGLKPLVDEFLRVDSITTQQELVSYFAYANKYAYRAPLNINAIAVDNKYELLLKNGKLKYPAKVYLNNDSISQKYRDDHYKRIKKMFMATGNSNVTSTANDVLFVETELAKIQNKTGDLNTSETGRELFKTDDLQLLMPNFNLLNFLKDAAINKPNNIQVSDRQYFIELSNLIKTIDLEPWKAYLKWNVLEKHSKHLTEAIYKERFNSYIPNIERQAASMTQQVFRDLIDSIFIEENYPHTVEKRAKTMVANIIKAYSSSIESLGWMSARTKKEALDKVRKLKRCIGYQKKEFNYDSLDIKPDDLFGNIKRIDAYNYKATIAKLGMLVSNDQYFNPRMLNGYYMSNRNLIWIAGAFFQPPYFDSDAEDAINYGALGAVIGHEIGHAFDNNGSKFDGDGKKRNWWTKEDQTQFDKKTKALIEQYNAFEIQADGFVNGKSTLGENIADLSGLNMAIKAYKLSLKGKEGPEKEGFSAMQRLFIGFAQMYCNKPNDAYFLQNSESPYPPTRYRVNGVVRNIPEFYSAFNIKPEDSLYISPNKRVKIW